MYPAQVLHMDGVRPVSTKIQSFGNTQRRLNDSDCCFQANQEVRVRTVLPQVSMLRNRGMLNGCSIATQPVVYNRLPQNTDLICSMPCTRSTMLLPVTNKIVSSNMYGTMSHRCPTFLSLMAPLPPWSLNLSEIADSRSQNHQIDSARFFSGSRNIAPTRVIHHVQHPIGFREVKEPVQPSAIYSTEAESTTSFPSLTLEADNTFSDDPSKIIMESNISKPKRALTAYNLFFKEQRELILAERRLAAKMRADMIDRNHDKTMLNRLVNRRQNGVGFEEMGKMIGRRWKELRSEMRLLYEAKARDEKRRYRDELAAYMRHESKKREAKFVCLQASVSEETKLLYFSKAKQH